MSAIKIKDGLYSVGVLNPALRTFDIVMRAEYGTSYNAYLLQGEKTALIETVHRNFCDELIENIESVTSFSKVDYLILNHTEPDHSGSLRMLLERNPNLKVYGSLAARNYLKAITNIDFDYTPVKQGDTLDLGGGRALQFIPAPFLHWPDSMFTYDPLGQTLFTCDFFGAHYCEPRLFDRYIAYPEKYEGALKYYFDCIFGPFKPYVAAGLDKAEALRFDTICPSHGPVLQDTITAAMDKYREWSAPAPKREKPLVGVFYASAYGYTRKMAVAACEALSAAGYDARFINLVKTPLAEAARIANEADALLVGTNTINRDATKCIWDLLSSVDAIGAKGKPAGAFGSYGWSGEGVGMVKSRMEWLRLDFTGEGCRAVFNPAEEDLQNMREYALEVASKIK